MFWLDGCARAREKACQLRGQDMKEAEKKMGLNQKNSEEETKH